MKHYWLKLRTSAVVVFLFGIYAGLTLLLAPPGNQLHLTAAGVSTAAFLGGQYLFGTRAALHSVDARPYDDPMANEILAHLADEMDVPKPDLMIGRMGVPNAFAAGRKGNGKIVLSETLIRTLSPAEIEAVIAHELSHLRSRDTSVMLLGQSLASLVHIITHRAVHEVDGIPGTIIALVAAVVGAIVRLLILLPIRSISRYREYIADWDAARFTDNPTALATGLKSIARFNQREDTPEPTDEVNALCIFSVKRSLADRALGTHPPLDDRVERLYEFETDRDEAYEN